MIEGKKNRRVGGEWAHKGERHAVPPPPLNGGGPGST